MSKLPTILDRRDGDDRREQPAPPRSALGLFANGKGEWLRWFVGFLIAGLLGWGGARARVAAIDQREQSHFEELLRGIERIEKRIERLDERTWQR